MIPFEIPSPALVVLVGAAGSGKSTLARAAWPGRHMVLSSDHFREVIAGSPHDQGASVEAFHVVHQLTAMRLHRKLTTVVDATSATRRARATLLDIAARTGVPAVAVVVHPPLKTVLARNAGRADPVPERVVRQQYVLVTHALDRLHAEGFTQVIPYDLSGHRPRPAEGS
jgi:predicted kinase